MGTIKQRYGWDTQFETAENLMIHTFTDRVQVVANIKNGEVLVKIDGHTVNTYYGLPLTEYEALLLGVEQYAAKLQRKDRFKKLLGKVAVYLIMGIALLALMALAGDNDSLTLGEFAAQKAACMAVMGCCYLSVKHTPVLAAAWKEIDNNIKE